MTVFLAVLVPLSVTFTLFFGADPVTSEGFSNFWISSFNMFKLSMVDFDDGNISEVAPWTSRILYVVWVMISAVIFLNLLIAMMGDSFSEFGGDGARDSIARWERAKIICRAEETICNYHDGWFEAVNSYLFKAILQLQEEYHRPSNTRSGLLRTYLFSDYDDDDIEPEISTSAVRTQILQAVSRLAQGQDDLKMRLQELEINQQVVAGQRLNALRTSKRPPTQQQQAGGFR